MPAPTALLPRQKVPALSAPLVGGGTWTLGAEAPERFTLVVFFRGLHCPICGRQLADLESKLEAFAQRGVAVVAISGDDQARSTEAYGKWKLATLPMGYGLSPATARAWGLFLSSGRPGTSEPAVFSEPGLFMIRADGTLYFSSVQTMPFARPHFDEMLQALDYVIKNDYPARGELPDAA